jgi:hypothetical protein
VQLEQPLGPISHPGAASGKLLLFRDESRRQPGGRLNPMSRSTKTEPITCTADDYRWLVSPEAEAPFAAAAACPTRSLAARLAQLRVGLSPARAHLIVEQMALRDRARGKFAAAARMFFTRRALEQATDEVVAAYKAGRFPPHGRVVDLCCGIGGDLIALARRGETLGVDRDPIMTILAEANCCATQDGQGGPDDSARPPVVQSRDAEDVDVGQCAAWHIDPDRRPAGRRTTRVDFHEPGPAAIQRLLARNPSAAVKLAPAAHMPDAWTERAELEWISRDGECRQLVAWFGELAPHAGQRRATLLRRSTLEAVSIVGMPVEPPPLSTSVSRYLFEPDAAALAAKLDGLLAARHGLQAIAPDVAYWTADRVVDEPALAAFEVREVLPLRIKRLKALLRERGIGRLEIKKRGLDVSPDELRGQLDLAGSEAATLLLTRIDGHATAILATRINAR